MSNQKHTQDVLHGSLCDISIKTRLPSDISIKPRLTFVVNFKQTTAHLVVHFNQNMPHLVVHYNKFNFNLCLFKVA